MRRKFVVNAIQSEDDGDLRNTLLSSMTCKIQDIYLSTKTLQVLSYEVEGSAIYVGKLSNPPE